MEKDATSERHHNGNHHRRNDHDDIAGQHNERKHNGCAEQEQVLRADTELQRTVRNTASCTQSTYNSAYLKYYGVMPTGPEDYLNVSTFPLPYGFYTKTTNIGRGNYSFVYKSESTDSDYNNSPAVTILINVSGSSAYNVTFRGHIRRPDLSWNTRWLQ